METLLYSEINILTLTILTVIALRSRAFGFDRSAKGLLFSTSIWFSAAANLFDFLWKLGWSEYVSLPAGAFWVINFCYFIAFGCSCYYWFLYSEEVQGHHLRKGGWTLLCAIPLVLLAAVEICSAFTGWTFSIGADGKVQHGPLFYLQHILTYGYIVISSVRRITGALQKKNFAQRRELLVAASFAVPPLICGVLQIIWQEIPILSVGIVISFLLVYMFTVEMLVAVDPLTGLHTRSEILNYLENEKDSLRPGERLYFLFLDVDAFKKINDTYGHNEGDEALRAVAAALRRVCERNHALCARYGGDEFAVAQVLGAQERIEDVCAQMHAAVRDCALGAQISRPITVSIGWAEYDDRDDGIQDVIHRADQAMYAQKEKKRKSPAGA